MIACQELLDKLSAVINLHEEASGLFCDSQYIFGWEI